MPPSPSQTLERLVASLEHQRLTREEGRQKLLEIRRALDEPMELPPSEPSPAAETARASDQTATAPAQEVPRDVASLLPARTTHGGFYGASVLARVIANYNGGE